MAPSGELLFVGVGSNNKCMFLTAPIRYLWCGNMLL